MSKNTPPELTLPRKRKKIFTKARFTSENLDAVSEGKVIKISRFKGKSLALSLGRIDRIGRCTGIGEVRWVKVSKRTIQPKLLGGRAHAGHIIPSPCLSLPVSFSLSAGCSVDVVSGDEMKETTEERTAAVALLGAGRLLREVQMRHKDSMEKLDRMHEKNKALFKRLADINKESKSYHGNIWKNTRGN
jgi:hypothetical protein